MSLISDVKKVLHDLFEKDDGWVQLMNQNGWAIDAPSLASMSDADLADALLNAPLNVDRSLPGFEDFFAGSDRLITPGKPYASLLYHALASVNVVATPSGHLLQEYPDLRALETVESYVYASRETSIDELVDEAKTILGFPFNTPLELAVCVFASSYRPAPGTVHLTHSDVCFSRTGIARLGNQEPNYEPRLRGFSVFKAGDDPHSIHVLPCRFSAYLAVKLKGRQDRFGPMDALTSNVDDTRNDFWVPLHKLFGGPECLPGLDLVVRLEKRHFNQKLEKLGRRLAARGFRTYSDEQLSQPPFRVEDDLAGWIDESRFGTGWLQPVPHPLVAATEFEERPADFKVPPMSTGGFSDAFSPTLTINPVGGARPWPEYAHVREQVEASGSLVNLTNDPNVIEIARDGDYQALHYTDFAADGWVTPSVVVKPGNTPLVLDSRPLETQSSYSLVSAPDFFPKARQRQIYEWWVNAFRLNSTNELPQWWSWLIDNGHWENLWRARPDPLSDERLACNIQLPDSPFSAEDNTGTAIVSLLEEVDPAPAPAPLPGFRKRSSVERHTPLPDAAAGIFAPGWDTSFDIFEPAGDDVSHLAAYGLGSPFPEDAKLCAALSTFWPAAAPDSYRTFFSVPFAAGSLVPLTDRESGVGDDAVAWDGITGPRVVDQDASKIEVVYQDYPRADATRTALEGKWSIADTQRITLEEYKRRVLAMLRGYRAVDKLDAKAEAHVVSFTVVGPGDPELEEAQDQAVELQHPIYRIAGFNDRTGFFSPGTDNVSDPVAVDASEHHQRYTVLENWVLFVGSGDGVLLRFKVGDGSGQQSQWLQRDA